jgi:hypothetical protein
LEPKERQASKLAQIREALVAASYDTTAKQAAVLGVGRSTAWWLLNHHKRAGPSAKIIKRILSSPQIPKRVRRKVEQYVEEKVRGIYGHSEQRTQWFSNNFNARRYDLKPKTCIGLILPKAETNDFCSAYVSLSRRNLLISRRHKSICAQRCAEWFPHSLTLLGVF